MRRRSASANARPEVTADRRRGGGSIEDLWAFNEEIGRDAVSRPCCRSCRRRPREPLHVIDFVADVRAPTPTARRRSCSDASPWRIGLQAVARGLAARSHALDVRVQWLDDGAGSCTRGRLAQQRSEPRNWRAGYPTWRGNAAARTARVTALQGRLAASCAHPCGRVRVERTREACGDSGGTSRTGPRNACHLAQNSPTHPAACSSSATRSSARRRHVRHRCESGDAATRWRDVCAGGRGTATIDSVRSEEVRR